jgi:hypothetical protein
MIKLQQKEEEEHAQENRSLLIFGCCKDFAAHPFAFSKGDRSRELLTCPPISLFFNYLRADLHLIPG